MNIRTTHLRFTVHWIEPLILLLLLPWLVLLALFAAAARHRACGIFAQRCATCHVGGVGCACDIAVCKFDIALLAAKGKDGRDTVDRGELGEQHQQQLRLRLTAGTTSADQR